jgi:hypothetical protein
VSLPVFLGAVFVVGFALLVLVLLLAWRLVRLEKPERPTGERAPASQRPYDWSTDGL